MTLPEPILDRTIVGAMYRSTPASRALRWRLATSLRPMDRRDALKKLGVGGAVAVSAPVLLDAFNVASASSTCLPATRTNSIVRASQPTDRSSHDHRSTIRPRARRSRFPTGHHSSPGACTPAAGNNVVRQLATGSTVVVDRPGPTNGPARQLVVRDRGRRRRAWPASSPYYIFTWTAVLDFNCRSDSASLTTPLSAVLRWAARLGRTTRCIRLRRKRDRARRSRASDGGRWRAHRSSDAAPGERPERDLLSPSWLDL